MLTQEQILEELAAFFLEEYNNNPTSVKDWVIQGDYDCDEFIEAVSKILKKS